MYKTTKEFLLRFGLNNVAELPSMEEFEKLGDPQAGLFEQSTVETVSALDTQASEDEAGEAAPEAKPENAAESSAEEAPVDTSTEDH